MAWTLTNEVRYVWDGMCVLQERDGNNTAKVTYTRGLDLSRTMQGAGGIGGLLARTDASGTAFYHSDAGGNVTTMTDSSGNVVARYLYDPYGNLLAKSGAMADVNKYRFSSKEVHPNSGLYYYGYRFYEPNLQRWLNEDPIGIAGGMNLYGFVNNRPTGMVDLYGEVGWMTDKFNDAQQWISQSVGDVGRGLYDYAMGENNPGAIPGSYGDMRSDFLGGIDPHDNVLRDAFGAGGEMLGGAFGRTGAAAASLVPGCAERLDYEIMCDPDARWWEKGLATGSLGLSAATLGASPNYGALRQAWRSQTRSYTLHFATEMKYHGKGSRWRSEVSAKFRSWFHGDTHVATDWTPAANDSSREGLKDEARRLRGDGGVGPDFGNYNQINSPGEKHLIQDGEPP